MDLTGKQQGVPRLARRGFRLFPFLRCLVVGHEFRTSRTFDNCMTCNRCKLRKRG